ncbi:membrane assembly protein AsmA [Novimethylophilus kurashikiensis]|uniref:Membrane assembly protein AsmA n=2 Tax=Novimethylophilus kurashikiensis TaxID=1825523 RepID=A0A2R5F8Y8_9PROT|nr:membrane assembly protein AsmA [Novimethylophilus kurashikiensis]
MIPTTAYLPQVEHMAAASVGAPVKINSLHLAIIPTPRILIDGITIGAHEEVRVDHVSAIIAMDSLLARRKSISHLKIDHPVIRKSALPLLASLASSRTSAAPSIAVNIRNIDIHEAELQWDALSLPRFDVKGAMQDGMIQSLEIDSTDHKLHAEITPQQDRWMIKAKASQWTPPLGPPLFFDEMEINATLEGAHLRIDQYTAKLYAGVVTGNAALDWSKDWRCSGKVNVGHMEITKPTSMLSKNIRVSGSLTGSGTFHSVATQPEQLLQRLAADFKFNVDRGVLHGMDLAQAASLFIRQGQSGGETAFDKLSGRLHLVGKQIQVQDLQVVSGLLAANGQVTISPAKTLNGQVDVELKKGLALVTVPLQVSGTVDEPVVMPTRAAVAGATAGTAVLGPLGTALGMKAGSAWDRWFGGKK